jgi:SAM-dependent methyltransferase
MTAPSYSDLYDLLYRDKDYTGEARLVLSLLGDRVRSLLDVGCGTGRHARAFADLGVAVVGIDRDPAMIAVARSTPCAAKHRPEFFVGGPNEAPAGPFDSASSLFNVVNYVLDTATLVDFFQSVSCRLPRGARFIFDSWNGLAALFDPPQIKRVELSHDGRLVVAVSSPTIDLWRQTTIIDVEIEVRAKQDAPDLVRHRFTHRLWTPRELADLLDMAGLTTRRVVPWGDPERDAAVNDWKLLFITERQ